MKCKHRDRERHAENSIDRTCRTRKQIVGLLHAAGARFERSECTREAHDRARFTAGNGFGKERAVEFAVPIAH